MYHSLLRDAKFYAFLHAIDVGLADETRVGGCECVHSAQFPRKPRAPCDLGDDYQRRFSFCCAKEGCRRRTTPPSVRFLGRKVYLAAVVIIASAMQHGVTKRRVSEIHELLGIGRRTLLRWRAWWQSIFAVSPVWRAFRGLIGSPTPSALTLPLSLVDRFVGDAMERMLGALRFLAPITTPKSGF